MTSEEESFQGHTSVEFRGIKHDVELSVQNDELLIIQIENSSTFDQWIGKYDVSCKFSFDITYNNIYLYHILLY